MPRPANPDTRNKLLEKGGDLLSRIGFNATGVQEITAAAGVPKGSFYNYFESKEAFAVEVLGEYWGSVAADYGPLLRDKKTSPRHRIANYFRGLAEFHKRNRYASGCLIGNMALEVTPSSADVRAKLVAVYREWTGELADCLREAQASKELTSTQRHEAACRSANRHIRRNRHACESGTQWEAIRQFRKVCVAMPTCLKACRDNRRLVIL